MPALPRSKRYCFTFNNYTDADESKLQSCDLIAYGIYGKEVAPTTGTPHLQGYIELNGKKTLLVLKKKLVKWNPGFDRMHLEQCKGSQSANEAYVAKDGNVTSWGVPMVAGKRTDIAAVLVYAVDHTMVQVAEEFPLEYVKYFKAIEKYKNGKSTVAAHNQLQSEYEGVVMRAWQVQVLDKMKDQSDRTILWVVDESGNSGKTWLGKYMVAKQGAFRFAGGKSSDIAYAYDFEDWVVCDLTRQKQDIMNYAILENFKDGMIFSPKYESTTKVFSSCKVCVFSNWYPDTSKLSEDRWDVLDLSLDLDNI